MKYRVLRTHTGRLYVVQVSKEEIRQKRQLWICVHATCALFFLSCCIAAGII